MRLPDSGTSEAFTYLPGTLRICISRLQVRSLRTVDASKASRHRSTFFPRGHFMQNEAQFFFSRESPRRSLAISRKRVRGETLAETKERESPMSSNKAEEETGRSLVAQTA